MFASVDPKRCHRKMMMTATSNKPPPSTKVRLEELSLDDRVNGSRSNDVLDESSGSPLPGVDPSTAPVDAEPSDSCCFLAVDGKGMRVPMKRKVSSVF